MEHNIIQEICDTIAAVSESSPYDDFIQELNCLARYGRLISEIKKIAESIIEAPDNDALSRRPYRVSYLIEGIKQDLKNNTFKPLTRFFLVCLQYLIVMDKCVEMWNCVFLYEPMLDDGDDRDWMVTRHFNWILFNHYLSDDPVISRFCYTICRIFLRYENEFQVLWNFNYNENKWNKLQMVVECLDCCLPRYIIQIVAEYHGDYR